MIALRRPDPAAVEAYRADRLEVAPTYPPAGQPATGRHGHHVRVVGTGDAAFTRARRGIERWEAHRGAGVEVHPGSAEVVEGATVAILTRQAGLWVLAACRIVEVVDGPVAFGFRYATLPDHPECGEEAFTVRRVGDEVRFEIDVVWRPASVLVRWGAPVARVVQRRATERYLASMGRWTARS